MTIELSLARRGLTSDDLRSYPFPRDLKKLDLSDNKITTLWGVRFPRGLEILILKNNALFFDAGWEPYPSRSLLSGERDSRYVSSFPSGLIILDVSKTLFTLHNDLNHLTKLENLSLQGARVSPNAQIPKSLEEINVSEVVFAYPKDLREGGLTWPASRDRLRQIFPQKCRVLL